MLQTVSPETREQADYALAQTRAHAALRSNPVVRFDPAAHILEFEFGTKRSTIMIILDKLEPFDRITLEQDFVDDLSPEIVSAPVLFKRPEPEADPDAGPGAGYGEHLND